MSDETTNGATTTETAPTQETTQAWAEASAASAQAESAKPREEKSKPYQDRFLVPMTDEDRARLIVDLGALASDIDVEEANAKAEAKEHRDSLDEKHKKLRELIRTGREGKIEKHLKVVDVRILSLNVLRIVRLDTNEVVFERPLAAGERQGDLFPPKKIEDGTPVVVEGGVARPAEEGEQAHGEARLVVGVDPADEPDTTVVANVDAEGKVQIVQHASQPLPSASDRGDPVPEAPASSTKKSAKKGSKKKKG